MRRDEYLGAVSETLRERLDPFCERLCDRAQVLFEAHVGADEGLHLEAFQAAEKLLEEEITLLESAFPDPRDGETNKAVLLALFWLLAVQIREIVGAAVEASRRRDEEEPGTRAKEAPVRYRAA
jgi:hypothetical protein